MLAFLKRHAAAAGFAIGALTASIVSPVAQGFLWVYPFQGAQPQATIDFSNPPISIAPQGGLQGAVNLVSNITIGSVAYGSLGNATTYAASTNVYVTSIFVPYDMTVTNVNVLNGGTVGTNSIIASLYNAAGTLIGNSATAGTATAGANAFQTLALTTPRAIQGPGVYYVGISSNGAVDNVRTIAASTFVGARSLLVAGQVFGTLTNLSALPTTLVANVAPIVYLN